MNINRDTRLSDLLAKYPFLKNQLPKVNAKFNMLNSPVAKVMLKQATVAQMSKRTGMNEEALIQTLTDLINQYN